MEAPVVGNFIVGAVVVVVAVLLPLSVSAFRAFSAFVQNPWVLVSIEPSGPSDDGL